MEECQPGDRRDVAQNSCALKSILTVTIFVTAACALPCHPHCTLGVSPLPDDQMRCCAALGTLR
eukprot:12405069-Karenia_brevis.AAC.1